MNLHRAINEIFLNKTKNVAVVGDFFLDKYLHGAITRKSSSSGVPIFKSTDEIIFLGGAGNVANNLIGLGCNLKVATAIGSDKDGNYIYNYLKENNVDTSGIIRRDERTNSKKRFVINGNEVFRYDSEAIEADKRNYKDLNNFIENWINNIVLDVDILVFSDYDMGFCSDEVCKYIISICKMNSVKIIVDSRCRDLKKYSGVNYILPNINEFNNIIKENNYGELNDNEIIYSKKLMKDYNIENIIITKGDRGLTGINDKVILDIKAYNIDTIDSVGAGDTVLSVLAMIIDYNISFKEKLYIINMAGAIATGERETYAISRYKLLSEIIKNINNDNYKNKIINKNELELITSVYKGLNKKIVFTNGCFDILHKGHMEYLNKAKELGDKLILALNTDNSIKKIKGINRPINNELDRAGVLATLDIIDHIILFNEETPKDLIKLIKPDILVKGGDYKAEDLPGREYAKETVIIDYIKGSSTTNTIKKVMDSFRDKEGTI